MTAKKRGAIGAWTRAHAAVETRRTADREAAEIVRGFAAAVLAALDGKRSVIDPEEATAQIHAMADVLRGGVERGMAAVAEHVRMVAEPSEHEPWPPWAEQAPKERRKRVAWLTRALAVHVHEGFGALRQPERHDEVAALLDRHAPTRRRGKLTSARIAAEMILAAGAWGERVYPSDGGHDGAIERVRKRVESAASKHRAK